MYLCWGRQGWKESNFQHPSLLVYYCTSTTVTVLLHLSPNWISKSDFVSFRPSSTVHYVCAVCPSRPPFTPTFLHFSPFCTFLHCVKLCIHPSHKLFLSDQSSSLHLHAIGRSWHSNSALLCYIKDEDILLRILPMWSTKVIYLGSSFCIEI